MPTIERFEDLEVWRQAREITRDVYRLSRNGAFVKDFGPRDQVCRSSVSTMGNIAEGFERDGRREFINFLSIEKGSAGETRSHLYVALDQNYITQEEFQGVYDKTVKNGRLLSGLMKYLNQSDVKGLKFRS